MLNSHLQKHRALLLIAGVIILYGITLQSIPNGSSHPYMVDTGETQVALNVWGTLHATGYPLYTILGNLFTPIPQIFGVNPAAAAGLFSTFWTVIALIAFYWLLYRVTGKAEIAAVSVFLLAVTRSVWIHSVIAEVYSMSLAILIGLWIIAANPGSPNDTAWRTLRGQIWALALLSGIGVAHHRAIAFAAVGIFFALIPALRMHYRMLPGIIPVALALFLLGFLPYAYLPLRASANAEWVYSRDVNTWHGFWFHFMGREADYLVTTPSTLKGWLDNFTGTLQILVHELSLPGAIMAGVCLMVALWRSEYRRFAWMSTLSGAGFFVFAVSFHQAVLPEAILMMALPSLVVGVALTADWLWQQRSWYGWLAAALVVLWGMLLIPYQEHFVQPLLEDRTGIEAIEAAERVPRTTMLDKPVLMLSWGPRFFAASYSRLVTGENADLRMVDHRADFRALVDDGDTLYTEPDTLYGYPPEWWRERIGTVYMTSAAYNLVRLDTQPRLVENMNTASLFKYMESGIWLAGYQLSCTENTIEIALGWYAEKQPDRDLSVKMHLTGADSLVPLVQGDSSAPVYGWRPTSTWLAGELIQENYRLPRLPDGKRIVTGFYEQLPDGTFANYGDTIISVDACE